MDGNCHFFANRRWSVLPCLLVTDGLIYQIFHHIQSKGRFAQRLLFFWGHLTALSQWPLRIA
jgi:hypothetical protein